MEINSLPALFQQTARNMGDKTALRQKKLGLWEDISWTEYYQQVRKLGIALIAKGLQAGDKVAILAENCFEWVVIDMAVQMAGGVSVGIYTTSAWQQVAYIVKHSECKFLFAENEEQVDKWLNFKDEVPDLQSIIYWDEKGLTKLQQPKLIRFQQFLLIDEAASDNLEQQLGHRLRDISSSDLAILVYTSGTTGPPKGAMLSHGNLVWMSQTVPQIDPGTTIRTSDEVMSFLPLCHIFERLFSVIVHVGSGYTVNFVESPDTVPQNLKEISPTIGYAVPRIWEKYYSAITIKMTDAKPLKRWVYKAALNIGKRSANIRLEGNKPNNSLRMLSFLAEKGVFYFLRQRMGLERMRFAFSGAAPISPEVLRFFHAIGLQLIEGYGQTESSGVSTSCKLAEFRLGTVGKAIPGAEINIAEDGEILFKSPGVFMGYFKNPESTAACLQEGWLYSGDIGELDKDGYLKIIDRKKDLIITAGGKNIAPQAIENLLKFSPYINDAIIIGDKRKFLSAIIVMDEDNIVKYAQDHKIPFSTYADLAMDFAIIQLIDNEVAQVNKQLSRVENVRKFTILPKKLYEEDGEVTPTMKVKRAFINETYHNLIEDMYA